MQNSLLIDSDVILDVLLDRTLFVEEAKKVLLKCEKGDVQGFITPVILSNVYYIIRKKLSYNQAIALLKQLFIIVDLLVIDKETVFKALNSNFSDFEDALQNYAAENHTKISIIVTRNVKDYKKSKLAVMTPAEFLNTL